MSNPKTGRVIVHFPYRSKTTGKTYNSVLLGLENNGRYSLPGGRFDSRTDKTTLDTALRELEEELGLKGLKSTAQKVYTFNGRVLSHDIYVVEATGKLKVDTNELQGIGFFNAGRRNQIPSKKLERHVQALTSKYFGTQHYKKTPSGIAIPGHYFIGNKDPKIKDWVTQRRSF